MWRELRDKFKGHHVHSRDPSVWLYVAASSGEPKLTCWKQDCHYRYYDGRWHEPQTRGYTQEQLEEFKRKTGLGLK